MLVMIFGYIYFPHCVLVVGGGVVWHIYLRSSYDRRTMLYILILNISFRRQKLK